MANTSSAMAENEPAMPAARADGLIFKNCAPVVPAAAKTLEESDRQQASVKSLILIFIPPSAALSLTVVRLFISSPLPLFKYRYLQRFGVELLAVEFRKQQVDAGG